MYRADGYRWKGVGCDTAFHLPIKSLPVRLSSPPAAFSVVGSPTPSIQTTGPHHYSDVQNPFFPFNVGRAVEDQAGRCPKGWV